MKGSQASEFRVEKNIAPNLDLKLDIHMDASGETKVDVIFARDDGFSSSKNTLNYSVTATQDGQTAFTENVQQYNYSTWHHEVSSNGSVDPHVVYDMPYLIGAGAVPSYDLTTDISASAIADFETDVGPMDSGSIETEMPTTGGRADIGPLPTWAALYLSSQSAAAADAMYANADAAGSVPWHVMDTNGDPVRIDNRPNLWLDERANSSQQVTGGFTPDGGWVLDNAHQPSLTYVPYLLSGSHYYGDELSAQAAYAIATYDPEYREGAEGLITDVAQVRDMAWTIRTLGQAAYALPDSDPMKAYFEKMLDNNLDYIIDNYVNDDDQGELSGYIFGAFGSDEGSVAPWQEDYFVTALTNIAAQGNDKATEILGWMDNFISGRFINEANGYDPLVGPTYELFVIGNDTWAEAYNDTFGAGPQDEIDVSAYPDWAGGYAANAKASVAGMISATQSPDAIEAYGWLQSVTTEMLDSYEEDPTWNISPKLADGKYLTNDEIEVHTGNSAVTMTADPTIEQMLIGGGGNDTVVGGSGIGLLFGMDGNDTVRAGSGNSYLYGGDGNDRLEDGAGSNYLKGGVGADVFSFTTANGGHDVVDDFAKGSDRIEIKSNLNGSGITTAAQVVAAATASADGAVLHFGSHDILLQGVMLPQVTTDIFTIVS
jgi:hypothetical protein